ncbi:hypothetical protein DENIS_3918 [Desulfonema ishimotonii]|uniref:Uncharacterized protein n=1 Tax=Desulfonema ishimotonii TaxID=45657 RepID=A0A401G140_9BACT|nr:DUF6785 family protein [Desulfonema ishimotonii]GBC62934.1 hypothetical protein DENIS_3918 [Desulfonema ishimotonii]
MKSPENTGQLIRSRAVILGIILAALICALTPYNNTYKQATPLGGGHFPLAPFFIMAWLTLLVAGAGRLFKKTILTGKEVLTVWMLMVLVSGIAYTGLARTFFINLTAPFHFATVENGWREVIQPLLPPALYPDSTEAVEALYNGLDGGRRMGWGEVLTQIPWDAWLLPLMTWGGFILLCYGVMICMVNLLSRQWLHNERMNLPLLRVPLLMEEAIDQKGLGRFFSDRFLLAGLAIPVFLHLLNGLHFYYPQVPHIPTLILAGPYFPKYGLFSGFHKLKIYIYPAFIGFAFLTSRQISFSFWFFFILGGLFFGLLSVLGYNIPAATLGITFGPTLSRPEETQMIGAYGVFFIFILWLARYHLLDVGRQAFGKGVRKPDETEWFSPPVAFWGCVTGLLGIVLWCRYFGMPFLASVLTVGAFFMVMLVATRVICQGGIAYFTLTVAPIDGLLAFFGPQFFTRTGLLVAAVVQKVLFADLRESLMPSLVHAGSITHRARNKRRVFAGILLTLLTGIIVSFGAMLALCYKYGARELQLDWATRTTTNVYTNIHTLLEASPRSGEWVMIFAVVGAVVMLALVICYQRFYWWPVHPIGYLTAYSSAMRILWISFFTGWLCNALCMRYGGVVLFKKFRYFFVGLIIGDFLMGGTWAVIGLFGDASYQVLPN